MKLVEDLRAGNTVKVNGNLFIVQKAIYNKGARGASSVKMKLKNLATGSMNETVYRAGEKFDDVVLERKQMQYLYGNDGFYTFMDQESFEQMDLTADDLGDALNYLQEQMTIDVIVYEGKAVGVELPIVVECEVTYTEPAVRGDTGGKVLKAAKITTGYEIQVPLYVNIGDKVKMDTRTNEFMSRA
jgi:elongation factor P